MIEVARVARHLHRAHLRAHGGHDLAYARIADLHRDPGADVCIVARWIAAAVQIQADGGSALQKFLAEAVVACDEQRHWPFDARAAPPFGSRVAKRSVGGRNRAHARSPRKWGQEIKKRHAAPDEQERTRLGMARPPATNGFSISQVG